MTADVFKGYVKGEYGSIAAAQTDEEIEEYVRNTTSTSADLIYVLPHLA